MCLTFRAETADSACDKREETQALAACREDAKRSIYNQQIFECSRFQEMIHYYEQVLGKVALSPEEEAAGGALSKEECDEVIHWAVRVKMQIGSCLSGLAAGEEIPEDRFGRKAKPSEGFREAYGEGRFPVEERPLVKICRNRWERYRKEPTEAEMRELARTIRLPNGQTLGDFAGDAGIRMAPSILAPLEPTPTSP